MVRFYSEWVLVRILCDRKVYDRDSELEEG